MSDVKIARAALELILYERERQRAYDAINRQIVELDPSGFAMRVNVCDMELWRRVMNLLDLILGDEDSDGDGLARYFCETSDPDRGGHGMIRLDDGREFPLNTVDDVLAYVTSRNADHKPECA